MITITLRSESIAALRRAVHAARQLQQICRVTYQAKVTVADQATLDALKERIGHAVRVEKE